ncbi:MAG: glucose-6-phosphate isomerase [Ignavibacteriaceae bacterium]|nr:glucose-6-phosphate isomerase [Ignavibacteriaceae bacterium]
MNIVNYSLPDELKKRVSESIANLKNTNTVERIWKKDPKLWKENPSEDIELSNRLGWLTLPSENIKRIKEFRDFADELKSDYEYVIVLGMGGSSLAPEVFAKTYGSEKGYPALSILDSTHPAVVKKVLEHEDLNKTLFVVASKSGGTAETMSFYYTIYEALANFLPLPGLQMVVLTDPGSSLEKLAIEKGFRKIFNTPAEVGGRFSALSEYGLVPAAMIGMDLNIFLANANNLADTCSPSFIDENNPGLYLGTLLGEAANTGIDKLTFIASRSIESFPQWAEQLIAESTGKEDKGILPVTDEAFTNLNKYGSDRIFVYLRNDEDDNESLDERVAELKSSGFPVIEIKMKDAYGLAEEFFRWEFATAVSGIILKINPFDQPNVQLAKTLANQSLATYKNTGSLPSEKPDFEESGISVFGTGDTKNLAVTFSRFFASIKSGDFVSLMAFLPYDDRIEAKLRELRTKVLEKYSVTTTSGYGPRFLHSTGQLHKGGPNNGLFIQITDSIKEDIDVPGQNYTFGVLVTAQAQGDMKALLQKERRVLRLHLNKNTLKELDYIISCI